MVYLATTYGLCYVTSSKIVHDGLSNRTLKKKRRILVKNTELILLGEIPHKAEGNNLSFPLYIVVDKELKLASVVVLGKRRKTEYNVRLSPLAHTEISPSEINLNHHLARFVCGGCCTPSNLVKYGKERLRELHKKGTIKKAYWTLVRVDPSEKYIISSTRNVSIAIVWQFCMVIMNASSEIEKLKDLPVYPDS
jgi:hypothetical protein